MKQEKKFEIRSYGKSELAMIYFPELTQDAAMKKLNNWLRINPRLRHLINASIKNYTPKEVRLITEEVGKPNEY